jgi:signal transduction histidine kinase
MSADRTTGEHTRSPGKPGASDPEDLDRFRLCYELLRYSTQGLLRKDFLPRVSERLREHSGCEAVEIWVKEGPDKHSRCSVTASGKMPFGFILVPCPLGEETSPPPDDRNELSMERLCADVIGGRVEGIGPQVTQWGSFWSEGAPDATACLRSTEANLPSSTARLPGPYQSVAIIPIRLEEECIGILQLKSKETRMFSVEDISIYEDACAILGVALSHQYAQVELRERIKEITCLYEIARVMARPETSTAEILQGIVNLLPPAWLYPEIACARIVLNGESYVTERFRESPHRQVSDIIVHNEKIGFVEVAYLERKLTLDEGPFLLEERSLIDNVARKVAIFHERVQAEEERASLEEQLRHADRLATIGQLAAGVAHELNEPLGSVLGFAQLAKKSPDLPAQVMKDLTNIETASLNAREIIKKLMTFARQLPPSKVSLNLNDIITDDLFFFEERCKKAGIQLIRRPAPSLPNITVDRGQVKQVLVNLVVNAIQAMPKGGTLTVSTRAVQEGICLSVEDTGTGMTDGTASKIFLPFFTTKDIDEGTGLGLAVVHGIVASHGGKISVQTKMGEGTRVLIHLPLNKPARPDGK